MSMHGWLVLVILCYKGERTLSFPAYEIPTETETKSHSAITMDAIFRTTATFLDRMQLVNDTEQSPFLKVSNYFGSDQESFQRYIQIIQEISGYESLVKRERATDSKYHVNGEQIEMAHILIKQIRNRIVDFSNNANIVKSNISLIREDVATILYIIQEFYSNTNWVELFGNRIYNDFGQENVTLKAVADPSEDTCINCKSESGLEHCENNTIGSNLTSGYRSGQRITKPVIYRNGISGKCSHGTPDDTSRTFTATGGIYKGRSNQNEAPHSYLHSAAAEVAVNATEYYLIDQAKGLLELIGSEVFRDIFGIRSREEIVKSSLTFVIDVASSKADISMIIRATEKIVNETKGSKFLPEKYVLVTFADSANSTTGNSTTDFQTLIKWLDNINVSNGGDCAESAMMGILEGIQLSNKNSKIYIMTDAREKNASLKKEVMDGLKAKNLNPIYILTGNCSRQSQKDVYAAIAKETGGKVYERNTAELKTVIETEIKETLPSSNVFITWFKMSANSTQNRSIPVDEYTETLVITVTPVTSMSEVVLYNSNGTPVSLSTNEETVIFNNVLKISILNPEPGQWKIQKNGSYTWTVNVTAQSAMDFSASILENSKGGNSYQLTGNPIKGNQSSVVVDIPNLNSTSTCSKVALLCDSGTVVFEFNVTEVRLNGITRYLGDFIPSNKSLYYIQIRGNNDKGIPFLRTRRVYIKPVSIQLDISPLFENLRLNKTSNISFSLTNTDENFDDFNITVSDGNKDIDVHQVGSDGKQIYRYVLVTPASLQTLILHFSITRGNFSSDIQTKTRRYSVIDTQSANCIVKQYPGMCPIESLNTENCTSYNWTGSVEVSSKTIRDSVIKISTDKVILNHMDLKDANFSVPIMLSGHCCIQTFVLTIIDTNGNFDECSFNVSEQPLTNVQYPSSSSSSSSVSSTTTSAAAAATTTSAAATTTTTTSSSSSSTTTEKQTTVAETSSYVTGTDEQTTTVAGFNDENFSDEGNSVVIGVSIGFTFLGLILVGIIVYIIYSIKKGANSKGHVAFLSYQTLKIKDENDLGVNEMLDKCHELHSEDLVATEDEINLSSLQKCENKENNDGNNSNSVNNTDFTKEQSETAENKTPEADTSDNKNKEKDTNSDDKKVTSINSDSGTMNAPKAGPESSDSINGVKIKEDDKLESSNDHGQNDTSSLSSESNTSEHCQNLNLEKGTDLDSPAVSPKDSCPANKQENNENDQTTQVVQTGKDKEGTEESSKERNEKNADLSITNDSNQTLAEENKSLD